MDVLLCWVVRWFGMINLTRCAIYCKAFRRPRLSRDPRKAEPLEECGWVQGGKVHVGEPKINLGGLTEGL